MWESLDKGANIVCRVKTAPVLVSQFRIEPVGTAFALEAGQVVELPLAGPLHPAAGQDFSGHYLLGVLLGVLFGGTCVVTFFCIKYFTHKYLHLCYH